MYSSRLSLLWATAASTLLLPSYRGVFAAPNPSAFENTAVVRTIDLGGATSQVTTSYQIRSLEDNNNIYYIALSEQEAARTSWIDAHLKGSQDALAVELVESDADTVKLYGVSLPKSLGKDESATLNVVTVQSHASTPLPATVLQNEPQALLYDTGIYVLSPYHTVIERVKFRSPNPNIISHTEGPEFEKYFTEGSKLVSKSGTTLTYGPFRNIPSSASAAFVQEEQQTVKIHYLYDSPVLTVPKLRRAAEISHWGANINIQDEWWLLNDGARLKGHFSRLEHIKQNVHTQLSQPHVVRSLALHLPARVRDAYYYDTIGNVSTSHLRPSPGKGSTSVIELKPRYPMMGGWNYTFTLGYDIPLENWVGYDASQGIYVAAVPFLSSIPGAAYDDVEVKIILPEGAHFRDIQTPFPVDLTTRETHITYLDTIGRPAVIFKKQNATDRHSGLVYVSYTIDTGAHLQKPFAVAAGFFGLFAVAMTLRRIDWSIRSKHHTA